MSGLFSLIQMPGSSHTGPLPPLSEQERQSAALLQKHVDVLAVEIGPRNIRRPPSMERTVHYLNRVLSALGYMVQHQEFSSYKLTSVNLEVEIPGRLFPEEVIVVGAHYDTVSNSPGANDNGSGVAALLELARLLAGSSPQRSVRLVAFANEEPPFFASNTMGSAFYAARCRARKEKIVGMLSLETIGYYSDEPGSQHYPFPFSFFYPDRADFIGFVGNIRSGQLVRRAVKAFRRHTRYPSEGLAAPSFIRGVGWSDQLSFWREGYPAIMVTDTAFYRYAHYHTPADTAEKLDYQRLARVVSGLVPTIMELARH
ncbi:M28 family peptidase [Desulfogranum mediterraneum]|uniref:M28 family peptidase n=1 Tax=Desulfogranum mediterraneum TaxID=160661 RepID=UPI000414C67B|nr:M28 family peptidase [Desulfogranum mediterraneum]